MAPEAFEEGQTPKTPHSLQDQGAERRAGATRFRPNFRNSRDSQHGKVSYFGARCTALKRGHKTGKPLGLTPCLLSSLDISGIMGPGGPDLGIAGSAKQDFPGW